MPGKLGRRRLREERYAAISWLLHLLYQLDLDHADDNNAYGLKIPSWMNPKHDVDNFAKRLTKRRGKKK
jgi:hypothetical protein